MRMRVRPNPFEVHRLCSPPFADLHLRFSSFHPIVPEQGSRDDGSICTGSPPLPSQLDIIY
eukprot:10410980-Karenia_brevis.AAC.1